PQQHTFAVQIAWNQGDVQITLTAPSGRVYDRTTTDPAAHHHVQANAESFAIRQPDPGQWTVDLFGARISGSPESVRVDITLMPMADFGPIAYAAAEPDRGVAPIAIQFTATANAFEGRTITSYRWDFGDCSAALRVPNPRHVFTAPGTYKVTLAVTDSIGLTAGASRDILVSAYKHAPTAKFGWGFIDASQPKVVVVDASPSVDVDGQITTYSWNFG